MGHNINRRPVYPKEDGKSKRLNKHQVRWKWGRILFCVLVFAIPLSVIAHRLIKSWRLRHSHIETTAYVSKLYKSSNYGIKCVSYYYCIENEWYEDHTSPPDSIWDNLQPGDPFEIVYEKGNPSNSNWAGYYTKR